MGHEIRENDNMFSVREVPWHGLGNVIEDYPTIEEAITASGLDWKASLAPIITDSGIMVHNHNAIVREDTQTVLGVVGNRYQIYQNEEMWAFIEEFQKQSGIKLETAGSLRNGRTTWVLAKNGTMETIKGDPIEEYFFFRNSFDGSSPISCLFTNIRVVCHNTLTAALRGTKNIFNVRHTASTDGQIKEVQKALGVRSKYQEKIGEAFEILSKKQVTRTESEKILGDIIFPLKTRTVQTVDENDNVVSFQEASKKAETGRKNNIEAVMNLVDNGAGTDIQGVRGNLYGLWNGITEWSDHEKRIRLGDDRVETEARLENAFFGTASKFKAEAFNELLKIAA
jgi:phage/plasmid-like protein (TIGR03299 family)